MKYSGSKRSILVEGEGMGEIHPRPEGRGLLSQKWIKIFEIKEERINKLIR